MLLLVSKLKKGMTTFYRMFACCGQLQTFFNYYKILLVTTYYFCWPHTTFDSDILLLAGIYYFYLHILLSVAFRGYILLLTDLHQFRPPYITIDGYMLFSALPDCDFVRIQDFPVVTHVFKLKARLEFNINLLALIQFCLI